MNEMEVSIYFNGFVTCIMYFFKLLKRILRIFLLIFSTVSSVELCTTKSKARLLISLRPCNERPGWNLTRHWCLEFLYPEPDLCLRNVVPHQLLTWKTFFIDLPAHKSLKSSSLTRRFCFPNSTWRFRISSIFFWNVVNSKCLFLIFKYRIMDLAVYLGDMAFSVSTFQHLSYHKSINF